MPDELRDTLPPADTDTPPEDTASGVQRLTFLPDSVLENEPAAVSAPAHRTGGRRAELDEAIQQFPEAAVNYLLRGELLLARRQAVLAQADLAQALALAQQQLATDAWGITAQLVIDRALAGLAHSGDF